MARIMKGLGSFLILLGVLNGFNSVLAATWSVDRDASSVEFSVKQMFVAHVQGTFNRVHGIVFIDEQDIRRSRVSVSIAAESLSTERAGLAETLKGPGLFHAAQFSNVTFHSKKVEEDSGSRLTVVGDLTIRGVTREVKLDAQGPSRAVRGGQHPERVCFHGLAKINRKEFGMVWNPVLDHGGIVVGQEVVIRINLELIQPTVFGGP